jgi:hypothetical protein
MARVSKLPSRRNASPTRLASVVGKSERDMLAILRRKLAAQLDKADVPASALPALIRQLLAVDRDIRSIDLRTAQVVEDEGDLDGPAFDPASICSNERGLAHGWHTHRCHHRRVPTIEMRTMTAKR